eukprot:scaffold1467_cov30-Tisochrysis_lutea.AAC.3
MASGHSAQSACPSMALTTRHFVDSAAKASRSTPTKLRIAPCAARTLSSKRSSNASSFGPNATRVGLYAMKYPLAPRCRWGARPWGDERGTRKGRTAPDGGIKRRCRGRGVAAASTRTRKFRANAPVHRVNHFSPPRGEGVDVSARQPVADAQHPPGGSMWPRAHALNVHRAATERDVAGYTGRLRTIGNTLSGRLAVQAIIAVEAHLCRIACAPDPR